MSSDILFQVMPPLLCLLKIKVDQDVDVLLFLYPL